MTAELRQRLKDRQTRDLDSLDCFGGVVGDVDVDADGLSMVIQLLMMRHGKQRERLVLI